MRQSRRVGLGVNVCLSFFLFLFLFMVNQFGTFCRSDLRPVVRVCSGLFCFSWGRTLSDLDDWFQAVVGLRVRPRIYIVIFECLVVLPWSGLQIRYQFLFLW